MPRLDPLPEVYYRRLGKHPHVMKSAGYGIVHRVAGRCVAFDFRAPTRGARIVTGHRWRSEPAVTQDGEAGYARVYVPPDEWVNAIAHFAEDGALRVVRVDAATPPAWRSGACYQTDLFLDLVHDHRTGNYVVADEEEFAAEVGRGTIPAHWAAQAAAVIAALVDLGDRDRIPEALRRWCDVPLAPNDGFRTRSVADPVDWPQGA